MPTVRIDTVIKGFILAPEKQITSQMTGISGGVKYGILLGLRRNVVEEEPRSYSLWGVLATDTKTTGDLSRTTCLEGRDKSDLHG